MIDTAAVIAAAQASPLMRYDWPGRRVAPPGYTKGMAVAFAKAYRSLREADRFMVAATAPRAQDPAHDVLDWYAAELKTAGAKDDTATARLIALFGVLVGLGMRESSGRHCEGPDTPEDRGPKGHPVPTTPENAEAGLFQVSYDSVAGHPDRQALIEANAGRNDLADVFAEGAHCVKPTHWPRDVGTGAPAGFQALTKECPFFAALYAAMLLRQLRSEWGPINRRRAEVRPEAITLFTKISEIVDASGAVSRAT